MRISISSSLIRIQHSRNRPKHLQYKRFPIHQIELLHRILDGSSDQTVRLMIGINLQQRRHDKEVTVGGENIFEMKGGVDVSRHDVTEDAGVFRMQDESTVQDVEEKVDIARISEIPCHCLEHPRDQSYPHEFVKDVQTKQLLKEQVIIYSKNRNRK